jgi:ferrous iron transport protein B
MAAPQLLAQGLCVTTEPARESERGADVVLVGNPNVGKSALFGALTGTYVTVSNYPGTTVELTKGHVSVGGSKVPLLDTPGATSLLPSSEDEQVTRDILLSRATRAVVVVGDAKNLERSLLLAVQIAEMQLPFVLCLNMMDEATSRGIGVDLPALAEGLGVDVVPTVAVRHEGVASLRAALAAPRLGSVAVEYPPALEAAMRDVEPLLPEAPIALRSLALMVLSGDQTLVPWLTARMSPEALASVEDVRADLARTLPESVAYVASRYRLAAASRLALAVVSRGATRARDRRHVERLDRLTTHPLWGLPFLALVLSAAYAFVGVFGAGTLVDLLEDGLFGRFLNPFARALVERVLPWSFARDLLVGPYGVVSMALTYSLALVLPIVATFFLAFSLLEDSGYLPRLAVMVNRVFRIMGLNGKAVLPMVLGLGCDTMATLTTRILETRKERLIVILLLALGVPCSAQLAVVFALLGALSPLAAAVWAGVVALVILVVGRLAALVIPGKGSHFVLELPPLRMPRPGNILIKTMARVEWYLKEAVPLFVLGTLLLFLADRFQLLGAVQRLAEPVVVGALGLPKEAAGAFVVGFLRRDFGAAGLFRLADEGRLAASQVLVASVTMTLFIPCIANFFMIVKERGWKTALAVAGFIFPFAVAVGAALNAALGLFPLPLV